MRRCRSVASDPRAGCAARPSSDSRVIAAGTCVSGRCVVASATRRPPPTSIMTTCEAPARSARNSVCPVKANAGVVDHALVHRCGDHGIEAAARTAVRRMLQGRQHGTRVARIEGTRAGRNCQRQMFERPADPAIEGTEPKRQLQLRRARCQEIAITDCDHTRSKRALGHHGDDVGTDAGRLPQGERNDRYRVPGPYARTVSRREHHVRVDRLTGLRGDTRRRRGRAAGAPIPDRLRRLCADAAPACATRRWRSFDMSSVRRSST